MQYNHAINMKFTSIAIVLLSLGVPATAQYYFPNAFYQKYNAPLSTCGMQSQCLQYSIVENETPTVCGSPCEYRVCWNQGIPFQNFWTWGWEHTCLRTSHVDFIGDMHGDGSVTNHDVGLCLNEDNADGKGYWDEQCTDPELAFAGSSAYFNNVCQNVPAGHTAHIMISDGGSCAGTAWATDFTGQGTYAFCSPSTQDGSQTNRGGQTFFPSHANSGNTGGTCSGNAEGSECIWSITVPTTCRYEEGDPCVNPTPNYNDATLCPQPSSLLKYYENDRNGPPPVTPIHDITLNANDDTVSFRVLNPFGDDLSDIYTVMHEAGGDGDSVCPKQTSATNCLTDEIYTAQCLDDGAWALVTIFVSGYDHNSRAAQLVDESGGQGTDVYKCCPKTTSEPYGRFGPEQTAAFTYLIHCQCQSQGGARALRVSDEVAGKLRRAGRGLSQDELESKFMDGELFDEELKQLYGLL